MKVISIINMKGGVAKTTSCHSIASRLGQLGKKVLVIDWDPQGDLSYMVFDENEITKNTRNLIDGETIENCILVSKDFDMVATADEEALVSAVEGVREEDRHYILSDRLEGLNKKYDYVLIDCPPTEGSLPLNALIASDYVFIPVIPEDISIRKTENTINLIKKLKNRGGKVEIGGIFITKYDKRLAIHNDNIEYLSEHYSDVFMKTFIPLNVRLSEVPRVKESIFKYSPTCAGAKAYKELTNELLEVVK
ncbi:MAG: ParA family protein [Fusobacteriaceae bacterium]